MLKMKKYYISFLIGLVIGLIISFNSVRAEISTIVIFVSGLISGYIASEKTKIGMINGLICGFMFSITMIIFYIVRSLEGFQIPPIPIIILAFILSLIVLGLICALGGATGSYIKKKFTKKN